MNVGLTAQEQKELESRMEKRQMNEFMKTYTNLVQRCFEDCVNDFTSKSLHQREEGCVMRCVDKFMKTQERLGLRFQEQNTQLAQGTQFPGAGR